MRKPLTVIIVTLSVVWTLKGMSRQSIQRIKAMLLYIVYGILFVKTVDTKMRCENYSTLYKGGGKAICWDCWYEVHPVFEMCYSKQREELMSTLLIHTNLESGFKHTKQRYEVHPVFEMFCSKQREFMLTLSIHAACNKIRSHPNSFSLYMSTLSIHTNMKTLNYSKVWFKALIYFGLEQTSN